METCFRITHKYHLRFSQSRLTYHTSEWSIHESEHPMHMMSFRLQIKCISLLDLDESKMVLSDFWFDNLGDKTIA